MRTFIFPGSRLVRVALALLSIGTAALATTIGTEDAFCPVCGEVFEAPYVGTTNSILGQDSDFFTHPLGTNPVSIYPRICPHCYFAGYQEDFDSTTVLPDSIKRELIESLYPPRGVDPNTSPDSWPPWLRYEQIRLTYIILGKPPRDLAEACLCASWCVRDTESGLPSIADSMCDSLIKFTHNMLTASNRKDPFDAKVKVAVGRELSRKVTNSGVRGETQALAVLHALAAIQLLRSHGENEEVLALIPHVERSLDSATYVAFKDTLMAGIELERSFQRMAVRYFTEAAEVEQDPAELSKFLYIVGELNRRLGHHAEARLYYVKALQRGEPPEWVEKWTWRQLGLIGLADR